MAIRLQALRTLAIACFVSSTEDEDPIVLLTLIEEVGLGVRYVCVCVCVEMNFTLRERASVFGDEHTSTDLC